MGFRGGPLRSSASAVSVPGWRVEDFHRLLTEFFEEGVVQGSGSELAVVQRAAGANMSVDVGSGLALIEFTTTLLSPNATVKSWLYSDDVENVDVPAADLTNPRIDRIVAKFDVSVDPNTAASNIVSIELIEGTPAGSPSAPAEPSNSITLATVAVAASASSITNANITDARPFVTLSTDVLEDVVRFTRLASTDTGDGASLISVEDDEENFDSDDVEGVLAELQENIEATAAAAVSLDKVGYGDGSDGAKVISADENLNPATIFSYSSIQLDVTKILSVSSVNKPLIVRVNGSAAINGIIDLNSKGAPASTSGASYLSGGTLVTAGSVGGAGVSGGSWGGSGGGGGGGSLWNPGSAGNGGTGDNGGARGAGGALGEPKSAAVLLPPFLSAVCGAGGGAGGTVGDAVAGTGGLGGGAMVMYIGGDLTLGASSVIRANGGNGGNGTNGSSNATAGGGGGGGGGVVVVIVAGTITNGGVTLTATGGTAGSGGSGAGAGGNGAAGKIVIFSLEDGTVLQS